MSRLRPTDIWNFGKYKGSTIESLPRDYLKWVVANFRKGPWRDTARRQLETFEFPDTEVEDRFIQGRMDCSDRFDPSTPVNLEPWDGFNPPFDLEGDLNHEFQAIVGLPMNTSNRRYSQELFTGVG